MLLTRATSSKEWVGEYGAQIAVKKRRSEACGAWRLAGTLRMAA